MMRLWQTIAIGLLLGWAGPASAQEPAGLEVLTDPSPITLRRDAAGPVLIDIKGLRFSADLRGDVNVGAIESIDARDNGTRIAYRPPELKFPQILCLMLWRAGAAEKRPRVFRVPMLGLTVVTVRTRSHSKIVISVGNRLFGPHDTGKRGRRRVRLLVAPGVKQATVRVTDRFKLNSTKKIAITTPEYNQLAMAVAPKGPRRRRPLYEITVAAADPNGQAPELEIDGRPVTLVARGGVWVAAWAPRPPARKRTVTVTARLADRPRSRRSTTLELLPAPGGSRPEHNLKSRPRPAAAGPRRLRGVAGVAVGLVHNLGAYFAPRVAVELGLDYRLRGGWIGLRALASLSRAGQSIEAPAGLEPADATLYLVPLGVGVTYQHPLSLFTPYLTLGVFAQLAHATTRASYVDQQQIDVTFAALGQVGAERRLGPGLVFLQSGFLWSRIDAPGLELLAGGVVVEAGYRFHL